MNEVEIQREIVKDCNKQGGFAFKLSNQFTSGVSDLFIQWPEKPTTIIEVKLFAVARSSCLYTLELTELQSHFLREHQAAGGIGGWLVVVALGRGDYVMWADGRIPGIKEKLKLAIEPHLDTTRKRGKPWPVREILDQLWSSHPVIPSTRRIPWV